MYVYDDNPSEETPYDMDFVEDNFLIGFRWPGDKDDLINWVRYNHADRRLVTIMQKLPEGKYTLMQLRYYLGDLLGQYSHLFF
jgi:hypothetical protein